MDGATDRCGDCVLNLTCGSFNKVSGWGNPEAPLVILLDGPGNTLAEKLLVWIIWKLGLAGNDVYVDYTLKCALPKGLKRAQALDCYKICWTSHPRTIALNAKSIVLAGNFSSDFIAGQKMKEIHGKKDPETEAWVVYDFKYLLMNPAECVDSWRVIFKAAEEAGLKPKMNMDVEPFRFPSKKLAGG